MKTDANANERRLLEAFEAGEWRGVGRLATARIRYGHLARATLRRDEAIEIGQRGRIIQGGGCDPACETERARAKAAREDTPADTGEASSDIGTHA